MATGPEIRAKLLESPALPLPAQVPLLQRQGASTPKSTIIRCASLPCGTGEGPAHLQSPPPSSARLPWCCLSEPSCRSRGPAAVPGSAGLASWPFHPVRMQTSPLRASTSLDTPADLRPSPPDGLRGWPPHGPCLAKLRFSFTNKFIKQCCLHRVHAIFSGSWLPSLVLWVSPLLPRPRGLAQGPAGDRRPCGLEQPFPLQSFLCGYSLNSLAQGSAVPGTRQVRERQ